MRYFLHRDTLFIRGSFRATGPADSDCIIPVSTLLAHRIPAGAGPSIPVKNELEHAAAERGFGNDYTGFAVTNPVNNFCIFQYDFITAFIMAGTTPAAARAGALPEISIIIVISQGLRDAAILKAGSTARTAVTEALAAAGHAGHTPFSGPVIVACEGETVHDAAAPDSALGSRIRAALLFGVPAALQWAQKPAQERPAFFIFSRFKGEHWVEWVLEGCPYYPCHFRGQRCDFCYCPLYPCGDESLGEWSESASSGKVWNCARCTMIHEPAIADYLHEHPEASKDDLVRVWKSLKK
jgi:adenosylcobinamide hydrolase